MTDLQGRGDGGDSDNVVLNTLQNGVIAINALKAAINAVFPRTTASSTSVTAGAITFTSSQASLFMIVQSSSGGVYKIPLYLP